MRITPAIGALGCGGTLITLGSFVSGFYLGHSQAKGLEVDLNLARFLKYAPAAIGGLYSVVATSAILADPENLEEMVSNAPPGADRDAVKGCASGCGPIGSGIFSAGLIGAVTYAGYAAGHAIGASP